MNGFNDRAQELSDIIGEIYELTGRLEEMYPGRHFTPDGHMVGSLGEVIAADIFGLQLFEASHPIHDATDSCGRLVQIKATQGDRVALSDEPDFLIVLRISAEGRYEVVYNGPGRPVWEACGKMQKTGQRHLSVKKLKELAKSVLCDDMIAMKDSSPDMKT